jgi:putative glycosyltransferase (TIGR04372 family)
MKKLNRNIPITKTKYLKIFTSCLIGIWFVIPILLLKPFKKIYLAPLQTSRIGHFILDTEIILARIYFDQINIRKKILVIWVPESYICNKYVYEIWKQKINIVAFNQFTSAVLLTAVYLEKLTKIKITYRFTGWDGYLQYVHLLEFSPTVFSISVEDEIECIKSLRLNGIDTDKEWVCILARDNKYLKHAIPNLGWEFNSHRNSDIDAFKIAAEYLAEKNIMTFRMGSNTEKPFSSDKSDLIVDYANSTWSNEKLDIFLAIKCLFFISTGTGLDSISVATRRPLLWVNQSMPLHVYRTKRDFIFITKYLFLREKNVFLSPRAFYNLGINYGFTIDNPLHFRTQDFTRLGVDVIDNGNFEIKDATIEMYELLTKKGKNKLALSRNQIKFWEAFPKDQRLDILGETASKVGENFLKQNPWLIN